MPLGQSPHFCDQVRREVIALGAKVDDVFTNVVVLVNREKPPCVDYNKRIVNLEVTKTTLVGGWKLVGILFGGAVGLASIITGAIILVKIFI